MALHKTDFRNLAESIKLSHNQIGLSDFEGYTPMKMNEILYTPFSETCPVQLKRLPFNRYEDIPLLNIVRYILSRLQKEKKIKLTRTGKLPVSFVADIYAQGYFKEAHIENGFRKLYAEETSFTIHLTHILLHLTGLVRKENGYLYVTKQSEKLRDNLHELLQKLLISFGSRFNMSYLDLYGEQPIGNIGWCYTLLLIHRYGQDWRPSEFYAEKYFSAFPKLVQNMEQWENSCCYIRRTFDYFLHFFGLVEIQKIHWFSGAESLKTASVFYDLISVVPPANYPRPGVN